MAGKLPTMGKIKSFAEALATPPQPSMKPTPWEAHLLGLVKILQQENQEMKTLIKHLQQKVEEKPTSSAHQEAPILLAQEETIKIQFKQEILTELKENEKRACNECKVRVGGLKDGWENTEYLEPEETDEYLTTQAIWRRKLTKAIPFVDIGEPYIELKGKHAIMLYDSKEDKIKLMKQTKSLAGTSVWIADELTPLQLKNRKKELARVKDARNQGKWAVYRNGAAVIGEFRKPKEEIYSPTRPLSPWS